MVICTRQQIQCEINLSCKLENKTLLNAPVGRIGVFDWFNEILRAVCV